MSLIHDTGLTELYSGAGSSGEPPIANIVFIHGLNGHPFDTWTAKNKSPTSPEPDPMDAAAAPSRKSSKFNILKRVKTGAPTSSSATSTFSLDVNAESVSPGESLVDPFTAEPEALPSPPIPGGQTNKKKIFWPRDLLPIDFPNTRIYTFGYDAKLVKPVGNATVSTMGTKTKLSFTGHAHDLMVTLNKELDDNTPIILCAHSLGGVLAKRALWVSHIDDHPDLRKLARLTKVVMFFGTPHHGSNKANVAEIATAITQLAGRDSRQNLATSLRLDSEILDNIHTDFLRLLRLGQFYIHNFIEGRPIMGIGKIVADYSSTIADSSGMQMHEVIDGDHRSMNRYSSAQDAGYRKVASALKHYMNKLDRKHDIERMSLASQLSIPIKTYFCVPYERNELFVGREECIATINKFFSGPKYTSLVSLHGLGGIGKTQVAIEFANRWRQINDTESVFWVHANDINNFNASLANILEELGIPPSAETNPRSVIEEWLRNRSNGRWLLIIDNVDDRAVLDEKQGKGKFKMLSCIPKVDHGHVLFTTRYKRIALDLANDVVRLDHMPDAEALELLKQSMGETYDESQASDADILLKELSYIPLAIAHAGAYIRRSDSTIARYLELFQESEENKMAMLEQDIEGIDIEDSESDDPKTVLKTSWLSFKRLKTDREAGPLATELLALMSFLDRQEIPRFLLQSFRPKAGSLKFANALDTLKVYSLITENTVTNTCAMHRLVQLSMRRWIEESEEGEQVKINGEDALKLLSDNFPNGAFETWDKCKALIVHADTVLGHTEDSENRSARAKLLQNCANYQDGKGQYSAAEVKFEEVVKLRTELVGADNTETLRAMDQLSWTLRNQAKKTEALELAKLTLEKKEKLFGKTSAEALTTSHIVATITGDQGKHQDAAKIHQANFDARKDLLGPEHLDTLRSASALSLELWELGKFVEAENLARQTLASRTEQLKEEHPDTLEIKGTLGFILEIQGKYAEALEVKQNMLEIRERIYGEDHPDTADSCHDMGWIYHQMGNYAAADPLYIRSLKAKRRLLGETHPKTLTTMCNLPVFYCDKGEYIEAEKRSKSLIAVFKQVQGDQHPQTLDATGGLAVILRHIGKLDEAAKAARTSIDGRNIVLGPDHPWTLPPISHWGYILTLQGSTAQGEEVIRGALASLEKAMGPESSNVLTSLVFLSKNLLLQATGPDDAKLEESEQLARRALESRKKLLGEKHPYTYKTMHHLSKVVLERGRHEDAKGLCKVALAGLRETLGLGHPDTMKCDDDLRKIRAKFGGDEAEGGYVGEEVVEVEIV